MAVRVVRDCYSYVSGSLLRGVRSVPYSVFSKGVRGSSLLEAISLRLLISMYVICE